jgi:hypothetical protein
MCTQSWVEKHVSNWNRFVVLAVRGACAQAAKGSLPLLRNRRLFAADMCTRIAQQFIGLSGGRNCETTKVSRTRVGSTR